ncbi:molybdopterin cofactor-binding domain-containing protein [Georgenia sp. SUBG003]|uniref:molybdopterin cofactor-binding domain-containing protein n=1 Tax=Georgenia sp. SUBG003 TaxID=1497974 RepID=UPI003AB26704
MEASYPFILRRPERSSRRQAPGHAGGGHHLLAARRTGKPCKWTETRSESLLSGHHGRDQLQKLTLAARRDGTVTGLKVELTADMGAYLGLVTSGVPILGAFMFNAIYKFPAYHFTCTNSPTRRGPTPTAAPAGPRPSRSSG